MRMTWRLAKRFSGTSLVAQWLRIHLPMQGTQVWSLVWEDPTCHGATKPMHHNYWACALEPTSHNYWACAPQLLKPACSRTRMPQLRGCVLQLLKPARLEHVLHNKRSHHNEKPAHHNKEQTPIIASRESPCAATETQCSQKKKKRFSMT